MKEKIALLSILSLFFLTEIHAGKPSIWVLTDFTGIKMNEPVFREKSETISRFNTQSDPDDYTALTMYLMNANKFRTVRIVLGSDGSRASESTDALDAFNTYILPAYAHDVPYWNSGEGPGGFPVAETLRKVVKVASTQGKRFEPGDNYKDFNMLPETVKELVNELKQETYDRDNPLYVIVWGPLTEVAMAVNHLTANKDYRALENLFIVSHWTTSLLHHNRPSRCVEEEPGHTIFGVANCNEDCRACEYLHRGAAREDAAFRFVDVGAIGQGGIVKGSVSYFEPGGFQSPRARAFQNSEMGKLFITSNFVYNRPDGSDCATFYTILGTYGVSLSDFNSNGQLTEEQEKKAEIRFKEEAPKILDELLELSNVAASHPGNLNTEQTPARQ